MVLIKNVLSLIHQSNEMKQSTKNQTYQLIEFFPAFTIEGWNETYKDMFTHCIRMKDDKYTLETLKPQMIKIKKFLKSKGYKFI